MKINRYYITHGCRKAHHVAPSRSVTLVSSSALTDSGLLASEWLASCLPCIAHSCPWGRGAHSQTQKGDARGGTKAAPVPRGQRSKQHQSKASPQQWQQSHGIAVERVKPKKNMALSRSTQIVMRERVCSSKSAAHSQARSARLASDRLRSDSRA